MSTQDERWGQPLIAVDVVPVQFVDGLRIGSVTRANAPFAGALALPGALLLAGELLGDAATRALQAKAQIGADALRHLAQIGTFDGPDRDPRSAAVSVSYVAVVAPGTGADSQWDDADALPPLAFDHDRIARAAIEHLRARLWNDEAMTRALLGDEFATSDAATLTRDLTGQRADPANLKRFLTRYEAIEDTGESRSTGKRGRPSALWRWAGPPSPSPSG